jgi:hypothetical protein
MGGCGLWMRVEFVSESRMGPSNNSMEQTPRAAANTGLDWASGRTRIIEDPYRRC